MKLRFINSLITGLSLSFLRSRILTYSRSRGLFAGLELKGVVITQDRDNLSAVYGLNASTRQVLKGGVLTPYIVRNSPQTLALYSKRRL